MKSEAVYPGRVFGKWLVLAAAGNYADCLCACGQHKRVYVFNLLKGVSVSCGCFRAVSNKLRAGPNSASWRGGKTISSEGYVLVRLDRAGDSKRMFEHRVVMMAILGRSLLPTETVHHKNGIKTDNRPDNLELWCAHHSGGQRVSDRVKDAVDTLRLYTPELLQ